MRVFYFIISLAFLIAGCDRPFDTALQTRDLNSRFSLLLPGGLQPMDSLHEFAGLQMGNDQVGLYAVAIEESKKDIDSVNLRYTAREYAHFALRNITVGLDSVLDEHSMEFSHEPFQCYVTNLSGLKHTGEGLTPIYTKLAVFESPTHFYQVMMWTQSDRLPELEPLMDAAICSARTLPEKPNQVPSDLPSGESSQFGMR
jgi:hypothetical protein